MPWRRPRGIQAVVQRWLAQPRIARQLVLHERLGGAPARCQQLPPGLAPPLGQALAGRGIAQLYSHQARAYELVRDGRDVVIATPTASGKSLCYHLPVLDRLGVEPRARALYLFPTKALARDQESALRALMSDAGLSQGVITYDGDTPGDARRAARERGGVLLTNPDMLHTGILPHHASWARLFSNLCYVVVDELHTYRGVFGSHFANVLRRLDRVARFHGSRPVFVFASATIGNPAEHASRMLGRPVELLDRSGAERGPRRVMVYNPPVVNQELGVRESYLKASVRLACDLIRADVTTLVFGQSRNNVEVMLKYLRDRLARERIDPESIQAYRGGYLPSLRRDIERGLREGKLRSVVATNALELGIDIGALDAVVCAGYPGTMAGLWQRFGRGGRRGEESLALLVTSSAPLDQYIALSAERLIGASSEQARIDPDNVEILIQHLKCAAFELPFERGERFGDVAPDVVNDALDFLRDHRVVHAVQGTAGNTIYHWATDAYPANHVSLRSIGWDNFVIVDMEHGKTIAEMDWRSVHTMLHEQAIYQQGAEQYQVEQLDFDNHKAFVRKVESDYFTDAMTYVHIDVVEQERTLELAPAVASVGYGEVSVVEKVVGYKKIKFHTHENVGYGDVRLPDMQMHTPAMWLSIDERVVRAQAVERPLVIDALRGFAHALHLVATVSLMVDPRDLGHTLGDRTDPERPPAKSRGGGAGFEPTLFLFDRIPGGVGLAERCFDEQQGLLMRARRLVEGCSCSQGCPGCVGPVVGASDGESSRKHVIMNVLDELGVVAMH